MRIVILIMLFLSNFVLLNEANATVIQFAQVPLPKGVTVDQNGYVYVQSLSILGNGGLYKFDPNGTLLSWNSNLSGEMRLEADAIFNVLWAIEKMGQLYYVDPNTLQAYPYLNVRDLLMSQSQNPVLNMLTGEKISLWAIDPMFGDIAVRHTNDGYDLFISGLTAAGGIPFVVRLRFDDNFVYTNIVVSSVPLPNPIIPPPFDTQPPGIAVNTDGIVLTALMDNLSKGTTPYYLTSFNADFPETNVSLPRFLPEFYGRQAVSFGMTDSALDKGFYFVTSANGLNCGLGPAVFHVSKSFDELTCMADLSDFGWGQIGPNDVAVGPDNNFIYVTMSSNNLVLRLEIENSDLNKPQQADLEGFVTRFYQECLFRTPDQAGLNYWVNALQTGTITANTLAEGFIFSQEFINSNQSNEEFLTIMYQAFFNRQPDQGGYNYWLSALYSGMSRADILVGFVNSVEFDNLCRQFGISPN